MLGHILDAIVGLIGELDTVFRAAGDIHVVVSDAVDVASVVVAVKAETMPVLKVPIMMRLITRTLAAENAIVWVFIKLR